MKLTVVGLGPGAGADLTLRARAALEACGLIVGYSAYVELVRADFPEKEYLSTGMRREEDRCRAGEEAHICTLEELKDVEADMFTTVFVGSSQTMVLGGKMVTPRGYLQRER